MNVFEAHPGEAKKRRKKLWIIGILLVAVLAAALSLFASVFRYAEILMTREPEPFSHIAACLVPRCDEYTFKSGEGDLTLSGWYFPSEKTPRATVVMVHSDGKNRLEFGTETAGLYQALLDEGFNVFAFDLRHSGKSGGKHSSFGMVEYLDVLAALDEVQKIDPSGRYILYGFGTGCTASLLAWDALPETPSPEAEEPSVTRDMIKALILDTPTASVQDPILPCLSDKGWLNQHVYLPGIPWAIRISSGGSEVKNLIPIASQIQAPLMITRNRPDSRLPDSSIDAFIQERLRLNPATTDVCETKIPGHLDGYPQDPDAYLENLSNFLDRWFD